MSHVAKPSSPELIDRPLAGIGFMVLGMVAITINDMIIKALSSGYPLHEVTFVRSIIGIWVPLLFLARTQGLGALRTSRPGLHAVRGLLIVCANLLFFSGLAMMSLAEATALFFAAPLVITLLSWPVLGERVGPRRLGAVLVGFVGVLIMLQPWNASGSDVPLWVRALPVLGAGCYAAFQMQTRKLGASSSAAAMAVYVQLCFIAVSASVFLVAGDGAYATDTSNATVQFLFRAWIWPPAKDLALFLAVGFLSSCMTMALAQAYRIAPPATVAPFEYIALPLAMLWGWLVWGTVPSTEIWIGGVLVVGSGLFILWRSGRVTQS